MVSELDCWMEWIENQMAEEPYDNPLDDEMEDFIGGIYMYIIYPHYSLLSIVLD